MQYLEDLQPNPTLLPETPLERARLRLWLKRIDDPTHPACGILTHATAFRQSFLAKSEKEQQAHFAKMPDPARRARQEAVYRDGLDAPIVAGAVRTYDKLLADMEAVLESSPWLAGSSYSLADAAATTLLVAATSLFYLDLWRGRAMLGSLARRRPGRAIGLGFASGLGLGLLLASAFSAFFWWWAIGAVIYAATVMAACLLLVRAESATQ